MVHTELSNLCVRLCVCVLRIRACVSQRTGQALKSIALPNSKLGDDNPPIQMLTHTHMHTKA
jgi:hypothetical protein